MYKMIYDIYFKIKRKEKKNKETQKAPSKMIMRILGRIEWYYNIIVKKKYIKDCNSQNKKLGINTKKRKEKIIVSLTSYPKRINVVWITIETLLQQTVKPDEVILWLADSQFKEIEELPEELKALQKRGLTIRFCDDLKSHKKYFYVLQEYKNDLVILTDDDMFYPKDMIERLLKLHEKYPKDICTMTGQVITPSFDSKPSEWRNPKSEEKFIHSDQIQIFTGSGSLYPPNSLSKEVFNKKLIKEGAYYFGKQCIV